MKKYNLFERGSIETDLYFKLEFDFQIYLLEYISYEDFFYTIDSMSIYNIEKWFDYFIEKYDENLSQYSYYHICVGKIIYKILSSNKIKDKPIEKVICFLKNKNISIHQFPSSSSNLKVTVEDYFINEVSKLNFDSISNKFWNIYFSDKIKNFKEIENFISLYDIRVENIETAKIEYNISANNHKYMVIKKNYLTLSDIEELEYRKNIQENNLKESWFEIYKYALQKSKNSLDLDKTLKKDLSQEQYNIFISIVIYIYREFNVKIQVTTNLLTKNNKL